MHSKEPLNHSYFKDCRIPKIVSSSWNNTTLAQQALLQEALLDPTNYKFVFLSESCLPLHNLDKIHEILTANDKTYMSFCKPWWEPSNIRTIWRLEEKNRSVNQHWVILNRRHAELLTVDQEIISIISSYPIDGQAWSSSALSVFGVLDEVENRMTTYVKFDPQSSRSLEFLEINQLIEAKNAGFLFVRKCTKNLQEDVLLDWIKNNS